MYNIHYIGQTLRAGISTWDTQAGGGQVAADSTPTWEMFEDGNDTAIRSGSFTARSGFTGRYRMSEALTGANGYDIGAFYELYATATVNSVTRSRPILSFYLAPPPLSLLAQVNTVTDNGDFTLTDIDALSGTNDVYNNQFLVFLNGNNYGVARQISDYVGSTQQVLFNGALGEADAEFPLTVVSGDFVEIIGLNLN